MMPKIYVDKNAFEVILGRRSVRSFKKDEISEDVIGNLLEAAIRAPTAMHQEPWGFVVIQDELILKNLSEFAKPLFLAEVKQQKVDSQEHLLDAFERPGFNIFYDAKALILICGRKSSPYFAADCWLAAENLMLAAFAMGLGSCVIGCALEVFNTSDVRLKLHIPEEFTVVAPIALGYPNIITPPTVRKKPLVFTTFASR